MFTHEKVIKEMTKLNEEIQKEVNHEHYKANSLRGRMRTKS